MVLVFSNATNVDISARNNMYADKTTVAMFTPVFAFVVTAAVVAAAAATVSWGTSTVSFVTNAFFAVSFVTSKLLLSMISQSCKSVDIFDTTTKQCGIRTGPQMLNSDQSPVARWSSGEKMSWSSSNSHRCIAEQCLSFTLEVNPVNQTCDKPMLHH